MNTVIKGTKTIAEYKRVREDMENLARANYARHNSRKNNTNEFLNVLFNHKQYLHFHETVIIYNFNITHCT